MTLRVTKRCHFATIEFEGGRGGASRFTDLILFGTSGPFGVQVFSCYVFTDLSANPTPFGDPFFLVLRFYQLLYSTNALRGRYLSLREERYRRKTRQRAPKSPFGNRFYTGEGGETCVPFYEFAGMQFTRFRLVRRRAVSFRFLRLRQKRTLPSCNTLRGCKHCFRRTLAYCTKCSKKVGTQRITSVS